MLATLTEMMDNAANFPPIQLYIRNYVTSASVDLVVFPPLQPVRFWMVREFVEDLKKHQNITLLASSVLTVVTGSEEVQSDMAVCQWRCCLPPEQHGSLSTALWWLDSVETLFG